MMTFNVITLFPEMVRAAFKEGVVGQAISRGEVTLNTINPRQFSHDIHQTVDDRPYGGGDGMVLQVKPLKEAIESLGSLAGKRVLLSAHGVKWSDKEARNWAARGGNFTLVCGRYGGVDQRFINEYIDQEISIGDFILSGGELGAQVLIDTTVRLLPNVLGNAVSKDEESFFDGLLEAPLFTRPQLANDQVVPAVLLSGDHDKIKAFRRALSVVITLQKRPDLITEAHRGEINRACRLLANLTPAELKSCGLTRDSLESHYGN